MNCLGRVGCAILLVGLGAALVVGWQHRERVERWIGRAPAPLPTVGRPSADALARAHERVDSLNGWRADSVLLLADEAAALVAEGLEAGGLALDSLTVTLDSGRVVVRGVVPVDTLPDEVAGLVRGLVGSHVALALGGPIEYVRPERARWLVDRGELGTLRLPLGATRRLIDALVPGGAGAGIPVQIPEGVTGLRLVPGALVLHGKGPDR